MNLFAIPNLLTLTNLFCGCVAVVAILQGNLHYVPYALITASFCDFFDGFVARAINSHSPIGKQLDSLADMVTFGLVPGLIFFHLLGVYKTEYPFIQYLGFFVTLGAALRLAKFNIDERQSKGFRGLATPAMTMYVLGLLGLFMNGNLIFSEIVSDKLFLIPNIFILAYLQICDIPMFAFKDVNKGWKANKIPITFIIITTILILGFQYLGLALSVVIYIIISLILNLKK